MVFIVFVRSTKSTDDLLKSQCKNPTNLNDNMALIVKHYFILKMRFRIFILLGSTDFTLTINQTGAKNSISEVQIKSLPKDGLNLRGFAAIGRGRSRIEFHELNLSRGPGSSTETLARQGGTRGILTGI